MSKNKEAIRDVLSETEGNLLNEFSKVHNMVYTVVNKASKTISENVDTKIENVKESLNDLNLKMDKIQVSLTRLEKLSTLIFDTVDRDEVVLTAYLKHMSEANKNVSDANSRKEQE